LFASDISQNLIKIEKFEKKNRANFVVPMILGEKSGTETEKMNWW